MNLLTPLARALSRWNHDTIMRYGGLGPARHLKAGPGVADAMNEDSA
jgi:hypothetical protein